MTSAISYWLHVNIFTVKVMYEEPRRHWNRTAGPCARCSSTIHACKIQMNHTYGEFQVLRSFGELIEQLLELSSKHQSTYQMTPHCRVVTRPRGWVDHHQHIK